jgi:lipoprotein NlpD
VITVGKIETTSMRCSNINMSWCLRSILLLFIGLFLCSCTINHIKTEQPRGVYHRVKSGESLWVIARAYKITVQDLAEANNITDPNLIERDSVIFIPDANQVIYDVMASIDTSETAGETVQTEKKTLPATSSKEEPKAARTAVKMEKSSLKDSSKDQHKLSSKIPASADMKTHAKGEAKKLIDTRDKEEASVLGAKGSTKQDPGQKAERGKPSDNGGKTESLKFDRGRFVWPIRGKVNSKFGIQPNGTYHNWIKISAKERAPVLAAAGGTVIFSDSFKDYGETIIIKHEDNFATVYTHLGSRMVMKDDQVREGSKIALPGKPSKSGESHINFEIRYKNKARNPLFYLP